MLVRSAALPLGEADHLPSTTPILIEKFRAIENSVLRDDGVLKTPLCPRRVAPTKVLVVIGFIIAF